MSGQAWNPVYKHGCGWRECPQCAPGIEAEIEAAHQKARQWPKRNLVSEWQAAERAELDDRDDTAKAINEIRKAARGARRTFEKENRVKRPLTVSQEVEALAILSEREERILKQYSKEEWLSEVWIELVYPTMRVLRTEGGASKSYKQGRPIGIKERVRKAIARAERRLQLRNRKEARLVSIQYSPQL